MPKTTEANTENNRAALKWESSRVIRSFQSRFLANGDVVGVGHADKIQQARDNNVLCAVISRGVRDGALSPIHGPGHDIESSRAHIAHESEDVEDVAAIEPVDASLHQQPENEHADDGGHEQHSAHPALLDEMSVVRNQPGHRRRTDRHARDRVLRCPFPCLGLSCGLLACGGVWHSDGYDLAVYFTGYFRGLRPHPDAYLATHAKLG